MLEDDPCLLDRFPGRCSLTFRECKFPWIPKKQIPNELCHVLWGESPWQQSAQATVARMFCLFPWDPCMVYLPTFTPPKFNIAPEKWWFGRLLSFWDGLFSGATLNFQGVPQQNKYNVGKYTIHGSYGIGWLVVVFLFSSILVFVV